MVLTVFHLGQYDTQVYNPFCLHVHKFAGYDASQPFIFWAQGTSEPKSVQLRIFAQHDIAWKAAKVLISIHEGANKFKEQ